MPSRLRADAPTDEARPPFAACGRHLHCLPRCRAGISAVVARASSPLFAWSECSCQHANTAPAPGRRSILQRDANIVGSLISTSSPRERAPPAIVSARQRGHHTTAAPPEGARMRRRSAVAPFDSTALERLESRRLIDTNSRVPSGFRCKNTTVSNYCNSSRRNLLDGPRPGGFYSASSLSNGRFGVGFLLSVWRHPSRGRPL